MSKTYETVIRTGSPCRISDKDKNFLRLLDSLWRSAQQPHLPGVHRYAGIPSGIEQAGGGICDGSRTCDELHDHPVLQI